MNPTRTRCTQYGLACLLSIGLLAGATANATILRIAWNSNTETNIVGYRLYAGTSVGNYTASMDVGMATETEMVPPPEASAMYFVVTAYNSLGLESTYSEPLEVMLVPPAGNRPPEITVNPVLTSEDTAVSVTVTVTDPDAGFASLSTPTDVSFETSASIISGPFNGTLTGSFPDLTYTPNPNFSGSDYFRVVATDGIDTSETVTVPIQVSPVNDAPVALPGSQVLYEDTEVSFVLGATDPDGDELTYTFDRLPQHGILTGTPPNLTYRPALDYKGPDSFTFKVGDGAFTSAPATVSITVLRVNVIPVPASATYALNEDASLPITLVATDADGDPVTYSITKQPSYGKLVGTLPKITYQPNPDYNGTDSFQFTANDGFATSPAGTVNLTIAPVNDPPVSLSSSVTTTEDKARTVTLYGVDPEGDAMTFTVQQAPANGTLSGTPPSLTYTPKQDYNGTDSFRYYITDKGGLRSATNTVTVAISPVNDAPTATAFTVSIPEDTTGSIVLKGKDAEGSSLSYVITQTPINGTLTGTPPNLTYRPKANYFGSDTLRYTVSDGVYTSSASTVTISIPAVNDPPVAYGSTSVVNEDGMISVTLTGADVEGSSLTFKISRQPANGTLTGTPPNVSYRGKTNFFGSDSFEFTASDGSATSTPAFYTLTVINVNDRPVAIPQAVSTEKNSPLSIVLNASDADGDKLTYGVTAPPANGTLSGTLPNVTYTPKANFVGTDTFKFNANDGTIAALEATVTITVSESAARLAATPSTISVVEDTPKAFTLSAIDPAGGSLTYTLSALPTNGTLSGTAPNLIYSPATNVSGSDRLIFTVSNGITNSTATVQFSIAAVNDQPTASPAAVTLAEDTSLAITLKASDVDSTTLTYAITTAPAYGTLVGTPPSVTYVPQANYSGPDSFRFTASDGALTSSPALVSITVTPVNDAPTAAGRTISLSEDSSVAVGLTGSDPDGNALSFAIVTGPTKGALSGTPPNLTYTPQANFSGEDRIQFTVSDGTVSSAPATIILSIAAVNDAPTALGGKLSVTSTSGTPLTLSGSDVEASPLTYTITQAPSGGTLSGTAPNLTYTPKSGFSGNDIVRFTVSDGQLTSSPATIDITVTSTANRTPVATELARTTAEDTQLSLVLTGSDPDGDKLTYLISRPPANGTLTGTPPNLVYIPSTNYNGADSFEFTVSDATTTSVPATVSLTITPYNDVPTPTPATYTVAEDGSVAITLTGVDPEGAKLYFAVPKLPSNGKLIGSAPNLTYRPSTNFTGSDSFTFTVWDGQRTSGQATIGITVTPVNDAPMATPAAVTALAATPTAITTAGTDVDGNALSYALVQSPANGTLTGTLPNVVYTPRAGFLGTDSLRFSVSDGTATSAAATVTITVKHGVITLPDALVILPGGSTTLLASGANSVLANDVATDGTSTSATLLTPPANGSLVLSGSGTFTYTHNGATNLLEKATYKATSTSGLSSTNGSLSIHVFRVLGGDVTPDGTEIEFSIVKGLTYVIESLDAAPTPESAWNTVASFEGEVTGVANMLDPDPSLGTDRYYRVRCLLGSEELVTEPWLREGAIALP